MSERGSAARTPLMKPTMPARRFTISPVMLPVTSKAMSTSMRGGAGGRHTDLVKVTHSPVRSW
jgi:hypothetical protein